jgi:hypothetical protein
VLEPDANSQAENGGGVRVDLPNLPGYGLTEAVPLVGDALAGVAAWQGGRTARVFNTVRQSTAELCSPVGAKEYR